MKMEDIALARQEVIFDVETIHGLEMTPEDRDRNHVSDSGTLIIALLDRVQRFLPEPQILFVFGIPT